MFRRSRPPAQGVRLPVDVQPGDERGVPKLGTLVDPIEAYIDRRSRAIDDGRFEDRSTACWGLVAKGSESLPWCWRMIGSATPTDVEDAVGVLVHIGLPAEWIPRIAALAAAGDSERLDLFALLLSPADLQRLTDDPPDPSPVSFEGVPLEGAHEPFTSTIAFVEAPFASVIEARRAWVAGFRDGASTRWSDHDGALDELLALLEPHARGHWKSLVVETAGEWTAVFDQGNDLSYVGRYASLMGTRVVRTSWSPHVVRDGQILRYGSSSMWLFTPDDDGGRTIQASRQSSRWEWHESGEPLPFEDPTRYTTKPIRDRFDLAALNDYCAHLGIRRADTSFYGPHARLEERDASAWPSIEMQTSAQWRAENS